MQHSVPGLSHASLPSAFTPLEFGVTVDYRRPFARNVHDNDVEALRGGADWSVGFVPFLVGDRAAFVRLTADANGDADGARATIERVVELWSGWPELNEFEHTRLDR